MTLSRLTVLVFVLPCLMLLGAGVALAKVRAAHDPSADFGAYRTYKWIESSPARSPELRKFLVREIESELDIAGLRKVTGGEADLGVAINVTTSSDFTPVGSYISGIHWDVGIILQDVYGYGKGTLIVDLVDLSGNRAVWQGVAEKSFTDDDLRYEKLRKVAVKIVRKMFKNYPPGN